MQFNVVSADTLKDAQVHPEEYKGLVVKVAGYSALFLQILTRICKIRLLRVQSIR